jgi:hypothetical protein
MFKMKLLPLGVLGLGAALLAGPAVAGSELFDPLSTCTDTNCQSRLVIGNDFRSTLSGSTGHNSWVAQIFKGGGNECLRIEGITQTTNLEAVLTCPGGRTWRDDDGGDGSLPLIIATDPTVPARPGWCTLTIHSSDGSNVQGQFQLMFGRYSPASQANCTPATPPIFPGFQVF